MEFGRLFSGEAAKGRRDYLSSQKKYEIIRTLIYFGISLAVFCLGYFSTKTKNNLLTIVAVLGCLPACKSLVGMIMFLRFQGLSKEKADLIEQLQLTIPQAFDMVFTTYQKNFSLGHLAVQKGQICGYTEQKDFSEAEFEKHITQVLNAEGIKNVSIKVFRDQDKYLERLADLKKKVDPDEKNDLDEQILQVLKSVVL